MTTLINWLGGLALSFWVALQLGSAQGPTNPWETLLVFPALAVGMIVTGALQSIVRGVYNGLKGDDR